jgi:hypothetical protein
MGAGLASPDCARNSFTSERAVSGRAATLRQMDRELRNPVHTDWSGDSPPVTSEQRRSLAEGTVAAQFETISAVATGSVRRDGAEVAGRAAGAHSVSGILISYGP